MENATDTISLEGQRRPSCLLFLPLGGITVLFCLLFSLSLTLAGSAVPTRGDDYRTFAKVSNAEKVLSDHDCRKYGGRPVTKGEYDLVMRAGRNDQELYNVLYFRGSQYVTFKIDASNSITKFFGIQNHTIWLCQF